MKEIQEYYFGLNIINLKSLYNKNRHVGSKHPGPCAALFNIKLSILLNKR